MVGFKHLIERREEFPLDGFLGRVRCVTLSLEFSVALPDDAAAFVGGMPCLTAVKTIAAAADDLPRKAACAVMRASGPLPSRQFILCHTEYFWLDDGQMAALGIILRYFPFVALHLLGEKVCAESLLSRLG